MRSRCQEPEEVLGPGWAALLDLATGRNDTHCHPASWVAQGTPLTPRLGQGARVL